MTPQAVLVCLFIGIVIGAVGARFENRPRRDFRVPPHGDPPSNVRVILGIYDQETQ